MGKNDEVVKASGKLSATESDAKVVCASPEGKNAPVINSCDNSRPLISVMSPNTRKSTPCYYGIPYPSAFSTSPHPSPSFPYVLTTVGYNQAPYCLNSIANDNNEANYVETFSYGGSPIIAGNICNFSAVQQEPYDLTNTIMPIRSHAPTKLVQGLAPPTPGQVHSPSNKSIWNESPYIGPSNSVVSPPNTPLSPSQPVSLQYVGGGCVHDLSFDTLSIGPGIDDNLSTSLTFDGSSVMQWTNGHETDVYISPHYMPPPQQVMVASNSHFTTYQPLCNWPSPGPPIQMTPSSKGPDGANLFVFHIPNNFSNADLWNLFRTYGNVVSVRIMVEKDTGRSRGFGFVSYEAPESAELAIKHLNGYAIGHKRLKVQHKQTRSSEHAHSPDLTENDASFQIEAENHSLEETKPLYLENPKEKF